MGWFGFGKRRKNPPMFKCIICQRRGADTYHFELPVCSSCQSTLNKRIETEGGAALETLRELQEAAPENVDRLKERLVLHIAKLVPYEDMRLRTTTPEPTEIIRRVNAGEYEALEVKLWVSES